MVIFKGHEREASSEWVASNGPPTVATTTQVYSVAYSPCGRYVASASWDGTIREWKSDSGDLLRVFVGHEDKVVCVEYCPDGIHLVSGGRDGTIRLWNALTGEHTCLLGHDDIVWAVAVSPDGRRIASASADRTVRVWDVASKKEVWCEREHDGGVLAVAFSHDGKLLLSGAADWTLRTWDAERGGPHLMLLRGHTSGICKCIIARDGRMLSASFDKTIRLWSASGEQLQLFTGHKDAVQSCAFSPNGKHVLSASWDETARTWDVSTGEKRIEIRPHNGKWVMACAYSPDGKHIVTGGRDGLARVTGLAPEPLQVLCARQVLYKGVGYQGEPYLPAHMKEFIDVQKRALATSPSKPRLPQSERVLMHA